MPGMSTFFGQSVVTDNMCLLVIGDLAFYYDMNALGIRHIKNNVRILLVNNNGEWNSSLVTEIIRVSTGI